MEKNPTPQNSRPSMGTSAATGVANLSGMPEKGKLVARKNTQSGDLSGPTAVKPQKQVTSRAAYGIKTRMPAYRDPQIGPTQGNGRLFTETINRTAPNFKAGVVDHN